MERNTSKSNFSVSASHGLFLRGVSGVHRIVYARTGTLFHSARGKRGTTARTRPADAGLPNTYARERKNNVMRGHDPVLQYRYTHHIISYLFYFNAKFTAPSGLRVYHVVL
ncbi:hypothetical protein QTP88_022609 [Uroleucon formosanum]